MKGHGKGGKGPPPPLPGGGPARLQHGPGQLPRTNWTDQATLLERVRRHVDTHLATVNEPDRSELRPRLQGFAGVHSAHALDELKNEIDVILRAVAEVAWVSSLRACEPLVKTLGGAMKFATALLFPDNSAPSFVRVPKGDTLTVADGETEVDVPDLDTQLEHSRRILNENEAISNSTVVRRLSVKELVTLLGDDLTPLQGHARLRAYADSAEADTGHPDEAQCDERLSEQESHVLALQGFLDLVRAHFEAKLQNYLRNSTESGRAIGKASKSTETGARAVAPRPRGRPSNVTPCTTPLQAQRTKKEQENAAIVAGSLRIKAPSLLGLMRVIFLKLQASIARARCQEFVATVTERPGRKLRSGTAEACPQVSSFIKEAHGLVPDGHAADIPESWEELKSNLDLWRELLNKLGAPDTSSENATLSVPEVEAFEAVWHKTPLGCTLHEGPLHKHVPSTSHAVSRMLRMIRLAEMNLEPAASERVEAPAPGPEMPHQDPQSKPSLQNVHHVVRPIAPVPAQPQPSGSGHPSAESAHAKCAACLQRCEVAQQRCLRGE